MPDTEFWLVTRRKEIGLRQNELARRLGIKTPTVTRWEKRKSIPMSPDLIRQLAIALKMSNSDVLRECGYEIDNTYIGFDSNSPQQRILNILDKCDDLKQKTIVKMVELLYEEVSQRVLDTMDLEVDDD